MVPSFSPPQTLSTRRGSTVRVRAAQQRGLETRSRVNQVLAKAMAHVGLHHMTERMHCHTASEKATCFTTVYLTGGYWLVPVADQDLPKPRSSRRSGYSSSSGCHLGHAMPRPAFSDSCRLSAIHAVRPRSSFRFVERQRTISFSRSES